MKKKKDRWKKEFEIREIITEYSEWLQKRGYIDTDWWCEYPNAIDAYIEDYFSAEKKKRGEK